MWPNFVPVLAWELYPGAKEVFLVRDFRDMARSIMAFDRRRGFAGFGRPDGITDEQYMRDVLKNMARDLERSWLSRRDRAHLLRYEDLVFHPQETLAGLLEYLELDASPHSIDQMLEAGEQPVSSLPGSSFDETIVSGHRTSNDLRESIGRWKREGDEAFQELSEEVFGEPLATFGYPLAGYPTG
jgi:hypothetical protein